MSRVIIFYAAVAQLAEQRFRKARGIERNGLISKELIFGCAQKCALPLGTI